MSRTLKIILILSIWVCFFFNFSLATTDENVLTESQNSEELSSDESNIETSKDEITNSEMQTYTTSSYGVTSVNRVNSYSEANLGLNNILNIILISLGILLILFAIAILIRLKH